MALSSASLALLVEIDRSGSLTRAAAALAVTPPAISQKVGRLEREVGASLVERGARGATLTPLGRALAGHGATVNEELRQAEETVAAYLGRHANRLRVGALNSSFAALVADSLAALRHQFPDAELSIIDLSSDVGIAMVRDGRLDVAVVAGYGATPTEEGVTVRHLAEDPLMVVAPDDHPLREVAPDRAVELVQLRGDAWVSGGPGRPHRVQLDDHAAGQGFVPHVPFETESYDVAQSLAVAGVALAIVPEMACQFHPSTITRRLAGGLARELCAVHPPTIDHLPLLSPLLRHLARAGRTAGERLRGQLPPRPA